MNARELEKKLGMNPGATSTTLVELAEQVSPSAPWDAFAPLWLRLPWLEEGTNASAMRCSTPKNVHPFAETGGDLAHFGFLLDVEMPTDERPIVYVAPNYDDEATEIIAPNLRAFLGLVAVAFGDVVSRGATDAEWAAFRRKWYGDDPARLAEMERLSALLCSIPGVVRPTSPASVANEYPNQAFELTEDEVSAEELIRDGQVLLPGVIRQEILSGIVQRRDFERIRRLLGEFPDVPVTMGDHERAAEMFNACRAKGIQGSLVDDLICALAERHEAAIFSTDKDFKHYAKVLDLRSYG